jgi:hypothetical protein
MSKFGSNGAADLVGTLARLNAHGNVCARMVMKGNAPA